MTGRAILASVALLLAAGLSGCSAEAKEGHLRLGYFPNLTHAQALYGLETGLYEEMLAEDGITLVATDFNAGPVAMEALLTGRIDITYVGPSPTINGILTAGPDKYRIISGAASGGARFIVQDADRDGEPDLREDDLGGKKFAAPTHGNTQDIALRNYLKGHGHTAKDEGGDVQVFNVNTNADALTLFQTGEVDGAWMPEPWATRLEQDGGGVELLDERDLWPGGEFVTTHLVTTAAFLRDHRATVEAFLAAHVEATARVAAGGEEVMEAVNAGIEEATGKALGPRLLEAAFAEVTFTDDPLVATFVENAEAARDLGVTAKPLPSVGTIYDLAALNKALAEAGKEPVEDP